MLIATCCLPGVIATLTFSLYVVCIHTVPCIYLYMFKQFIHKTLKGKLCIKVNRTILHTARTPPLLCWDGVARAVGWKV